MCLPAQVSEAKKKEFLKQARKRGYIRVYKHCPIKFDLFIDIFERKTGSIHGVNYRKGLRKDKQGHIDIINYGWHTFLTKQAANRWLGDTNNPHIMTCYAKPSWLKGLSRAQATFTCLVFPSAKKKDMTIREFKEICRKHK